MNAHDFLAQFSKMLLNVSALLDKAQTYADQRKFDPARLLEFRLAPDQFNLTKQIQIATDTAKTYVARLTDKPAPKFEDKETTIAQLQDRLRQTVQFLESVNTADFQGWEARKTTNPRREGKYLPGSDFAMQHAIPNFFFHITTAYAILRAAGLEIGKKDYLGDIRYLDL